MLGTTGAGGRRDDYKTVADVKDENLGMSENPDYFTLKATVMYVRADGTIAYPSCKSEGCNKKVVEERPGEWRCERCDRKFDAPEWRYIFSMNVSDWTGSLWLTGFDDVGQRVFGASANEVQAVKDEDEGRYKEYMAGASSTTWIFRCRAKLDTFQEQQR